MSVFNKVKFRDDRIIKIDKSMAKEENNFVEKIKILIKFTNFRNSLQKKILF